MINLHINDRKTGVEKTYSFDSLDSLTLLDLIAVKQQTGLGLKDLQAGLQQGEDGEPDMLAFSALVWLARRKAGEKHLSFEQAVDFPLADLRIENEQADDESEDAATPDPTAAA